MRIEFSLLLSNVIGDDTELFAKSIDQKGLPIMNRHVVHKYIILCMHVGHTVYESWTYCV